MRITFTVLLFSIVLTTSLFANSPAMFSYQGRLFDDNGDPIDSGSAALVLQVLDPTGNCLLFEESHSLPMVGTDGYFRISVGLGTKNTSDAPNFDFKDVFSNTSTFNDSKLQCVSYTPGANDHRLLRVHINGEKLVPDHTISTVPYSIESQNAATIEGKTYSDITNYANKNLAGSALPDLQASPLTNGDSFQWDGSKWVAKKFAPADLPSNSVSLDDVSFASSDGIAVPSLGAAPSSPAAGQIYFNSVSNKIFFYNGITWVDTSASTGGDFKTDGSVAMAGALNLNGNYLSGDGGNEGIYVDTAGNVGIGTTTPNSKFTVEGVMTLDEQTGDPTGTAGYGSVYAKNDGKLYYRDGVGTVTDLLAVGGVGTVTQVDAGTGLTGGSITGTGTIGLADTTVTAAAYGSATQVPSFTVDAQGRLTAAANVTITDNNTTYSQVTGAADGLMIAADKTKLNSIEASATADQTDAEILTAVKAVDGVASGLDADLLDAQSGAYYLAWGNLTGVPADIADGDANTQLSEAIVDGYANNNGYLTAETQSLDATYNNGSSVTVDSSDVIYNLSSTQDFHIQDAGGAAFTVTDSGNVGIGTTAPQSALQVSGYAQLDIVTGTPPAADCDIAAEYGRMKVDAAADAIYVCMASGWVNTNGGGGGSGGAMGLQFFETSGVFTIPAGITSVKVTSIGGGGGYSTNGGCNSNSGGTGGSGFALVSGLTPGSNITVTVGGPGSNSSNSSGPGGASSFGSQVTATGGVGGVCTGGTGASGIFSTTGVGRSSDFRGIYNRGSASQSGIVIVEW